MVWRRRKASSSTSNPLVAAKVTSCPRERNFGMNTKVGRKGVPMVFPSKHAACKQQARIQGFLHLLLAAIPRVERRGGADCEHGGSQNVGIVSHGGRGAEHGNL